MGLFLQTVILPNCKESLIKTAVEQVEERTNIGLIAADCLYKELNDGVNILLNRHCFGYEELAKELSLCITQPVLLLYIYDDDFWGYFFYENGNELDRFNPMPDYFEDVSEEERESFSGNSKIISKYFNVNEEDIKNYLNISVLGDIPNFDDTKKKKYGGKYYKYRYYKRKYYGKEYK